MVLVLAMFFDPRYLYALDMVRASDIFPKNTDSKMKEVRSWLNANGVRDMEAVSLFCDNLDKV